MLTLALLSMVASAPMPLDGAIKRYNALPEVTLPVAIAAPDDAPRVKAFALPMWLTKVALDPVEASALVGLVEFRGSASREERRNWTAGEYAAGLAAQAARNANHERTITPKGIDFDTVTPPLRTVEDKSVIRYQRRLSELGSCTGALASALTKLRAARPSDDFTHFAFRARQRLGTAMLPPDTTCVRGT
ncbi:hypothetical protein [Sphingomonas sp. SUN039]|uniref:hypothetical protein n=1 Tax=Sphingomonas sp. SUN039 TaxID=2937787 RepID=UPI0021643EE7|nr:hypothetical protein [Sphingomonas sp. SUN039]UVO52926.1 hypothetical protein M0209_01860 [Sphingomonas sp. SUN039]